MALTKEHLVDSISNHLGMPKVRSAQLVEFLLEIIKSTLESGEDVMISGFGKFSVKEKSARPGRNPQTGETVMVGARRVVTFRCSPMLKERINGVG